MQTVTAIEIEDIDVWDMLCAIQPAFKTYGDGENHIGSFLVVTLGSGAEGQIIRPQAVAHLFDHIESMDKRIKLVKLVK